MELPPDSELPHATVAALSQQLLFASCGVHLRLHQRGANDDPTLLSSPVGTGKLYSGKIFPLLELKFEVSGPIE